MKNWKKYLWAVWLGISLAIAEITIFDWEYYVILVPTAAFIVFFNDKKQK